MRYNVPVHQSGLYLLCIVGEPFIKPFFNPPGRGQLSLCNVKGLTSFRSLKYLQAEKVKIKGLGAYDTLYSLNPISYIL